MHTFPGWTSRQPLPSPWYSGYVSYEFEGRMIHTHYVLVLAEEEAKEGVKEEENGDRSSSSGGGAVEDKPLIYWSNGGPGASSMVGLLIELGPLLLNDLSKQTEDYRETGIPTPMYNPYSWTKLGHLLILDVPAPVGFSYCLAKNETTSSSTSSSSSIVDCAGLAWTDELAAANTFTALQAFYQKYPQFLSKNLFLTGESYAGIYIPTLAREILKHNHKIQQVKEEEQREKKTEAESNGDHDDDDDLDDGFVTLPLKGFAVGDGCLGTETGICSILDGNAFDFWLILFLAGHNQIPLDTFQEVMKACQPFHHHHHHHHNADDVTEKNSEICQAALAKVRQQVGYVYDYGLYDECTYENGLLSSSSSSSSKRKNQQKQRMMATMMMMMMMKQQPSLGGGLNDYVCGGDVVLGEYLKLDIVREAFHVSNAQYYETDDAKDFAYTTTEKDLTGFYRDAALHTDLAILVYNGDTDPAITSFATQNWTSHLGLKKLQEWRPWTVDGCRRMGGYVTRYEGSLDFLTIRGSGHMVPMIKPAASFTFLKSWLQSQEYPHYVANCTAPLPPPASVDATKDTRQNVKGEQEQEATAIHYVRAVK
ncbi:hypothetical protein ACA910_022337 [Epithemia clementina (nom. ined.)]